MFHSRVFAGMITCLALTQVESVPIVMRPMKINTVSNPNIDNSDKNVNKSNVNESTVNKSNVNESTVNKSNMNDININKSNINESNVNKSNMNDINVNNTDNDMSKNMSNFTFFF